MNLQIYEYEIFPIYVKVVIFYKHVVLGSLMIIRFSKYDLNKKN